MPPHYIADGKVINSLITEGCEVKGVINHSVLFAGVTVAARRLPMRSSCRARSSSARGRPPCDHRGKRAYLCGCRGRRGDRQDCRCRA
ncbi:MAG: hypothetical protein V8Q79_03265 [Christensenellales bacterium]